MEWLYHLNELSIPFMVWLQQTYTSDAMTAVMRFFSFLGTEYFFLVAMPLIYWTISKRWGAMMALGLVFSSYVAGFVKWTFNIPRPPSPPVERLWSETSPGFISGHAATAMGVWGTLAALVRRGWFWGVASLLIFFIGFSRIYLGVHYPSDVVGGWLAGALVVVALMWAVSRWESTVRTWSTIALLSASLLLSLFLIAIFPVEPELKLWPAANAVQLGALLFGVLAGLVWDVKSLHFSVDGPWRQRLFRFFLGLIILIAFYVGPKLLLSFLQIDAYGWLQFVRFLRYALVGFVVSGLAPWSFRKLSLAR